MMLRKDEKKKSVGKREATRCQFERHGRQCGLIGNISPGNGEGSRFYCLFHNTILPSVGTPNDRYNYKEFEIWHREFLDNNPLTIYGSPEYNMKSGEFLGYKGGQFHDENSRKLWIRMGNPE